MPTYTLLALLIVIGAGAVGAEERTTGELIPRAILVVPVGSDDAEPEVIFSVSNTGKAERTVNRLFTPGSELEWKGPRGITWRDVIGSAAPRPITVPAGTEVIVGKVKLHDLYLKIPAGASVNEKTLLDGDVFRVSWIVDSAPSNELLLRYTEVK